MSTHTSSAYVQSLSPSNEPRRTATGGGESLALNPDLDDEALGTGLYWDTYFGADKDRSYKDRDLQATAEQVAAHQFSTGALAGNLLQYAKQGIAMRFGKRLGAPAGRLIGGTSLREIIWQGRNQALHWDEGAFDKPAEKCFQELANISPIFADYKTRNMAFEIVTLLRWNIYEDVQTDLPLLDP